MKKVIIEGEFTSKELREMADNLDKEEKVKPVPDICWGIDGTGDLALKIFDEIHILYKWGNPTISKFDVAEFTPLTDANTKPLWKCIRSFIKENYIGE
jgi:hypothetical protein